MEDGRGGRAGNQCEEEEDKGEEEKKEAERADIGRVMGFLVPLSLSTSLMRVLIKVERRMGGMCCKFISRFFFFISMCVSICLSAILLLHLNLLSKLLSIIFSSFMDAFISFCLLYVLPHSLNCAYTHLVIYLFCFCSIPLSQFSYHLPMWWRWSQYWMDPSRLCWRPGPPPRTGQTSSGCPGCTPHCPRWLSSPLCCTGRCCPGRSPCNRSGSLGWLRSAAPS